jgi:cytochrome c-type biogenesis protein CcmH
MFFWVVAALLTLVACLAVLLPLVRNAGQADPGESHDLEVYRDQLDELDRDVARGLIDRNEAGQARAEIGRRILLLGPSSDRTASELNGSGARRAVGTAAVLAVPLIAWGIYIGLGSPELPSQPLAERLAQNPAEGTVEELVARAEAHLAANPEDGRGWDVLAPIYLRLGRAGDAVTAYRNAITIKGATPERESGLGEAIAAAAGGMVSSDAQAAFERAHALDGNNPKARFYLATAMVQEGRLSDAAGAWRRMLAILPADSPWRTPAEEAIAEAERRMEMAGNEEAPKVPTQDEIESAAAMSPTDRAVMIEGMVAQLDEKLRASPRDPEGWRRLLRSYQVLGKVAEAQDALKRGVAAFGPESDEAKDLEAFAVSLGLPRTE